MSQRGMLKRKTFKTQLLSGVVWLKTALELQYLVMCGLKRTGQKSKCLLPQQIRSIYYGAPKGSRWELLSPRRTLID